MHRTCCPGDDYPFSATRINDSNNEAVQRLERLKVSGVCRRSGVLQCCVAAAQMDTLQKNRGRNWEVCVGSAARYTRHAEKNEWRCNQEALLPDAKSVFPRIRARVIAGVLIKRISGGRC